MTAAQLARVEAMAHNPSRAEEDRAALTALLAERTALREALANTECGDCSDLIGLPHCNVIHCTTCDRARAALGETA